MIGSVVGNYKIIDRIGEGGMGAVFKGVDLMLEREVAIKMLRPELARQPNIVERFRAEAVTLAKLSHTNVATLHSFFRQDDDFFMVMEFVRGQTLDAVIRQSGALPCDRAIELFCMALEGIDHAHKMGIVHRDIKPANMMLTETGSIKVMDFGIARVLGTDRMTKTGHLIGTVEYMSPEQVRGEETDARSDIYSLGILLYEMLTGRVPFNSNSEYDLMRSHVEEAPTPPRTFASHIPLSIEQAIMRALAKRREARYQSASEFRRMLLQKNLGAITTPLVDPTARTGGFAASNTQADRASTAPASGELMNETRLAGDQRLMSANTGGHIKETKLGQPHAAYSQAAPGTYAQQPGAPVAGSKASLLSKLNWKHFAGAGVSLVAIFTITFLFIGGGKRESQITGQPAIPPQTNAPTPDPAQNAQPQGQPVATPQTTPGGLDNQSSATSAGTLSNSRPRDARAQKNANVATPPETQATPVSPSSTEPPSPPPKQDNVASTEQAAKKEAAKTEQKKDEKKKGGIGGFFKKVFGGSDKNKNDKKP